MSDRYEGRANSAESPASHGFAVTPSDSTALAETTRALYVGGAGDISVLMQSGASLDFTAVPVGTVLPIRVDRVNATGTTASAIVALV